MQIPFRNFVSFNLKSLLIVVASERFQDKSRKIYRAVFVSAVVICLSVLFYFFFDVFSKYLDFKRKLSQLPAGEVAQFKEKKEKKTALKSDDLKKIFGAVKSQVDPSKITQKPAVSRPKIALLATFVYPDKSFAIFEHGGKNQQEAFEIGEKVFEEATLEKIQRGHAVLKWPDGVFEDYFIEEEVSGAQSVAAEVSYFNISRETLNEVFSDVSTVVTQIRAIPFFKDGKPVGLRLFAIRPGSVFEMIGLKNGDLVKSVDGIDLTDLGRLNELMGTIKEKDRVKVLVERENKEQELVYEIR